MLSVEMLNAERGDAILIEYGLGSTPTNRVLIDGGPVNSGLYSGVRDRLLDIELDAEGNRHFDLLVISHVDADHIEGVIRLLQDTELRCTFDDVWFNGWKHIEPLDPAAAVAVLGAAQGEFLGALLAKQNRPWNEHFGGDAIFVPDDGPLPEITLSGGLELTLLSPMTKQLARLAVRWKKELEDHNFNPGEADKAIAELEDRFWARPEVLGGDDPVRSSDDKSAANGSSIAFLATWQGRSILLAADAYDDVLTETLRRLRSLSEQPDEPIRLDALKLSHHGSENNTTPQLMHELHADAYLVSSNGSRFRHPNALAIRTVIDYHRGPALPIVCFNYRQENTDIWDGHPEIEARFESDANMYYDMDGGTDPR